jgi:DNA (cytosine-5)-methyltransferase 1
VKHLGDITKISGYVVPAVDIVVGGSPCQDLSVAGKREGLAGARSGLFMEQVRIVKEMRDGFAKSNRGANEHIRPRFMVWENVPGAFSSNKGEDFRAVLEEVAKMATITLQVNPAATQLPAYIIDKHYQRKHGPNSYYGQVKK